MDSPINLLRFAILENDDDTRLNKIIRSCKIITETLPFEEKRDELIQKNEYIFRYLLLSYIFAKAPIKLIMDTLLEKNGNNKKFINNCWIDLFYIASISEEYNFNPELNNSESDFEVSRLLRLLYINDPERKIVLKNKNDFCNKIASNLIEIKLLTLNYSLKIFGIICAILSFSINLLDKNLNLYKLFLINTLDDKIFLKTCQFIEKVKSKYVFAFKNIYQFDAQIEEILLSKKSELIKSYARSYKNSITNNDKFLKNLEDSSLLLSPPLTYNFDHVSFDEKNDTKIKLTRCETKQIRKFEFENEVKEQENEEITEEEFLKNQEKLLMDQIDKWLCFDEKNIISINDSLAQAFKKNETLEKFMVFICDPTLIELKSFWPERYESTATRSIGYDYRCFKFSSIIDMKDWVDSKLMFKSLYFLRSYKASSVLCNKNNLRYLLTVNDESIDTIFTVLKNALADLSKIRMNLFHIAKIINCFLLLNTTFSINIILKFDFLNTLSINTHNPLFYDILISILIPTTSKYKISWEDQFKIWHYCYMNNFFENLCNSMLKGVYIKSTNEKMIRKKEIEKDHTNQDNYMIRTVRSPSKYRIDNLSLDSLFGINTFLNTVKKEYLSIEEFTGEKKDIDSLKNFIKDKNKIFKESSIILSSKIYNSEEKKEEVSSSKKDKGNMLKAIDLSLKSNNYSSDFEEYSELHNTKKRMLLVEKPLENVKSIPKGRKLFQKLRIILKFQNTNDLYKRIIESESREKNSPSKKPLIINDEHGERYGYSSSPLLKIYPNDRNLMASYGTYDQLARLKIFFSESVLENEKIAYPISELLFNLIKICVESDLNEKITNLIGLHKKDNSLLFDTFFDNGCVIFNKIFINYIVKFRTLYKLKELNNSAYECGKTVNLILKNIQTNNVIKNYKKKIHSICLEGFNYFCKLIIFMESVKRNSVCLQNIEIDNPLGTSKLMIVETLFLILKNDESNNYKLIEKVNETIWHILILWFFGNRTNDIFLTIFYKIISIAFSFGSENLIIKILFKVNFVSSLYNSFEQIFKNGVASKYIQIDSYILYLHKFIKDIDDIILTKKSYCVIKFQIENSQSWKMLKSYIENPRLSGLLQTFTSIKNFNSKEKGKNKIFKNIISKSLEKFKDQPKTPINNVKQKIVAEFLAKTNSEIKKHKIIESARDPINKLKIPESNILIENKTVNNLIKNKKHSISLHGSNIQNKSILLPVIKNYINKNK